jgi:hypothetical protein
MPPATALSRYWAWLSAVHPVDSPLVWCHTTDGYRLRSMIESGAITPQPCSVFNKKLVYAFYGRPGYRSRHDGSIGLAARAPVIVTFRSTLALRGTRLYPFDTGAYAAGRYQRWLHPNTTVDDFALPATNDAARKHVSAFFQSNDNYLKANPKTPQLEHHGEFEVEQLKHILSDIDAEESDTRRLAMELQVDTPIPLNPSIVDSVVLPAELQDSAWLTAFVNGSGAGISIVAYDLQHNRRLDEYQMLLESYVVSPQLSVIAASPAKTTT